MKFRVVLAIFLFCSLLANATSAKEESGPVSKRDMSVELEPVKLSIRQKMRMALFSSKTGYLDLEDGQVQSVFNLPGRDWATCDMDTACKSIGWPDNNSEITILSPRTKVKTYDFREEKYVEQEFVKVHFKYERKTALNSPEKGALKLQEGEGWMDAAYISDKKRDAFFTEKPKIPPKNVCDDVAKTNRSDLRDIAKNHAGLNEIAAAVQKVTGQCVIDPRQPRGFEAGNIYDNYVMPTILQQKVPKLTKEDGTNLTSQDLVDIDSLARTIYGEMAGCFKHGLQYPMALAKIVQNRSMSTERNREFIKGPHISDKSPLAKVVTTSSQFNVWSAKQGQRMNPSLKMALCPPSNKNNMYWQGHKPPVGELQIWENAIRIAAQAVVQPAIFAKRTQQIKGYFYTSGMGKFYQMKQVFPMIEDRKVAKNSCLEVWMERTEHEKPTAKTTKSKKKKSRA